MSVSKSALIALAFLFGLNWSFFGQSEQYTYSRVANKFEIFNSKGENISSDITYISNFNSLFYYVYVPNSKTLLKLSYLSAAQNKTSVAEKVLEGKEPNFIYFDDKGDFYIYCEGRELDLKDVNLTTPNTKIFVMSPKDSNYSYTFLYSQDYYGITELKRLPPNSNNFYWSRVLMKGDVTKSDFVVYANGSSPKLENVRVLPNGHFLFSIENQYFEIKNFKSGKLMAINKLPEITKTQYDSIINATVKKVVTEVPKQLEQINKQQKLLKEINSSKPVSPISQCKSDTNCLLQLSEKNYNQALQNGQTQEQAYDAMTKVFVDAYEINPKDTYEMMMNMKSEHVNEVVKRLPKDIRSSIRSMSMQTVKEYEKTYGTKEIKTVPYKPKKN
ncbi:hypothetical protein AB9K26_04395 [Psychroserpens sp. XS_ASV72]|uniref:hypothetical protein n=1 Tax=Psychroserpens sp. XS_ASV72 TaxID=3241293 RepID=UPI003511CADE